MSERNRTDVADDVKTVRDSGIRDEDSEMTEPMNPARDERREGGNDTANDDLDSPASGPSLEDEEVDTNRSKTNVPMDRRQQPGGQLIPEGYIDLDGVVTLVPDLNDYATKKSVAQGMMDLALLTANVNQLRYVVECYNNHPYFYVSITLISLSLLLQITVGISLLLNVRYNVKEEKGRERAHRINNFSVLAVFLITMLNVLISSFGVANPPAELQL